MNWFKKSALVLVGAAALWFGSSFVPAPAQADNICWVSTATPVDFPTTTIPFCDASHNLKVAITGSISIGSLVFPYSSATGQTATASSFIGVAGFDGTNVTSIRTDSTGRLILGAGGQVIGHVIVDSQVFPYNMAITQAITAGSAMGIVGFDGTNADVVRVGTDGRLAVNLSQVGGSTLAFGQATMANSIPVAFASNQSSLTTADTNVAKLFATATGTISANGNTVIKNSAGRLFGVNVTTTYATTALTCFDNASTNSGTVLFLTTTTQAPGTTIEPIPAGGIPFANGLTCSQGATGASTISYQ